MRRTGVIMKKIIMVLLVGILVFSACEMRKKGVCEKGVCIDVGFRGRIQEWGTAIAVITIESDHDINGLGASLSLVGSNMKIIRSISTPGGAELLFQEDKLYNWQFDALADEIYTITAEIEILPPKYSVMQEGDTAYYDIQASVYFPEIDVLGTTYNLYLNYLGQEVEPGNHGAEEQVRNSTQVFTVMPTPTDTIEPPPITPTPRITPSATIDSYPPSVESMFSSTEEALPTGYP
jgi:hypothetical protein